MSRLDFRLSDAYSPRSRPCAARACLRSGRPTHDGTRRPRNHPLVKRPLRAENCFRQEEHAQVARSRRAQSRAARRPSHCSEERQGLGLDARSEEGRDQVARSRRPKRADPSEQRRAAQEQGGEDQVDRRPKTDAFNERAALDSRPFLLSVGFIRSSVSGLRSALQNAASSPPHRSQYHSVG